jgi:TolA-binding protein
MRRSAFVVQAAVAALLLGWGCRADEAEDQFNFATGLLIKNEFALAAEEFQALLARHPRFGQADVARYRLGEALQKAGDTAAARAAFEQLLRDHPQSDRAPQAHYWLAQMLADDDPAAAAAHYGEVVARRPDSPLA